MLEANQGSPFDHQSKTFRGVRFILLGFDPIKRSEVLSKLLDGGGVDVGQYCPNCTHVIVDKLVYDEPVCVAARSDGKILVNTLWVEHSFDVGMPVDASNIMYRPLKGLTGIPGAKSLIVCLTGYQRQDREDIMTMVGLMGANFSKPLVANKVTHLVCYKFEGEKYELAKKMKKIKLVNHRWLEDCLKAWEIRPEAEYDKSTYELEMMEAEAKDSEEETEGIATKQCGEEATTPHQIQVSKPEVSRNPLDSSASKRLLNVGNTNHKVPVIEKTRSDQAPYLHKLHNDNHELLGSHDVGTLRDVTLGEQSKQYDGLGTPVRVGNDLVSTSTSAKRSPHFDVAKLGSMSCSRKTPRRTTPPDPSGELASNLRSSPMMNIGMYNVSEGFGISSFNIEQAKDESDFSGVKTPSKETDVLPEADQSGTTLPEKRKIDVSSGSSKIQKTSHNSKATISEGSLVANRSEIFEPASKTDVHIEIKNQVSPGNDARYLNDTAAQNSPATVSTRLLASFDRKSVTPATPVSKTLTSEIREDENVEEELQAPLFGSEKANVTSKSDKTDPCMSSAKDAIGEACEPEDKVPNIGVSSPTTQRSETHKSNGSANLELLKGGSVEKHLKPVRSKMLAKKFLGSKKRLGKGTTANQKGSIYLNNSTSQNDAVTCSIGGKETTDYSFVNSKELETDVVTVMEADTKDTQQSGNEDDNKSEFMDDETEAPDDKEENEPEVAAVEEKHAEIEPEEKFEDVQQVKNNEDISMAGKDERAMASDNTTDESEQKRAVCGKKSEVVEPTHVKNGSKERITKVTKRPSGKTKKKIVPSVTKTTNSNRAANEKVMSERDNEKIQGKKKECIPHLAGKAKGTKYVNKLQNTLELELEKENRPIDSGHTSVNCGKKEVEKVASSKVHIKIDSKADESDLQSNTVERGLKTNPVWFILTGHKLQRKEFQQVIRRLKGRVCRDSHLWSYQATHFIVPDRLGRTEKFFAAAASGRWILKIDYLTDSNQAGRFLAEEPYEWHKNGLSEDGAINLEAPRKWRLLRERTGHGAFHGMRIIIYGDCIAPSLDTLKRVVKAGDGTILATSPPYSRFLESRVDFAIVSPGMPRVDVWVQEFIRHEIPCVVADYLVEYVCKPGYSLERHVQYNTHAWAEKSFKNMANRLEEITEEVSPQKDHGDEDTPCQVCGSREREEVMLICGDESGSTGCGVGTHIDCCDPPLECVPEEDWFCPKCILAKNSKNFQQSNRKGGSE
ncbi:hypothetical protein LguiB_030414 [Lonicera macranthoides]